jgi:hypothetical protein
MAPAEPGVSVGGANHDRLRSNSRPFKQLENIR